MTGRAPDRPRAAGRHRRWVPAALWAAGLLAATSWPNPDVPDVGSGDKVVHAALYAVLTLLVARAEPRHVRRLASAAAIIAAGSAFGALDEWHQQFIPGRSRSTDDWVADTIGAALGAAVTLARATRSVA